MICAGTPLVSGHPQFQDLLDELKVRSGRLGLPAEQTEDFDRCREICHRLRNECQVGELRMAMAAMAKKTQDLAPQAQPQDPVTSFDP